MLLCVRPSSEEPDWGGPGAVLNIGMNDARYAEFSERSGQRAPAALYLRFVQAFAVHVARLDPDSVRRCLGRSGGWRWPGAAGL
jgi:pyruvate,orthophosphate dikinase